MTLPTTFGVTVSTVRQNRFPHLGEFGANTAPSSAAVGVFLYQAASRLEGKLLLEKIVASSISDVTSAAYFWCQETLELMVAVRISQVALGSDNGLAQSWREELRERFEELDEGGAQALGAGASITGTPSDPDGPTTHISEFGLTVDEADNMSTVVPRLRRDDKL